ncbi:hypothetical protein MP228_005006 [Amoeboaphelidium protococcarum]|nr:hypothetical protein MP228_012248 [Amoeboaphelidium protococcarum]KAI3645461.1 hypothetical protein MP228_008389 [Amoeboaphelidium protococcarum]KAI3650138.1 hypothetical protein MP228_005006 [Amoeboaphelidium protococcarum]
MRLIVGDDQFKASTGWVYGFLERFGLSLRAITCRVNAHKFTSIRDNFDDKAEKMAAFRTYIKDVIYQHQFSDLQIYNVDQTPVWFDHPPSKVIDHRGAKQVYCKSMVSNLREKATVVLAVRQDGYKLPPLVVVKTSQKRFRLKLVNGVMLFLNPRSSMMNSDLMSKYMKLIFGQSREQRLLILDSFRGHLAQDFADTCKSLNIIRAVIPGGLTGELQPLDIAVNRSFKSRLRTMFSSSMNTFSINSSATSKERIEHLMKSIIKSWTSVPKRVVLNGFRVMYESEATQK